MKRKIYGKKRDMDYVMGIDASGGQFMNEEHVYVMEKEFRNAGLKTKDGLVGSYTDENRAKIINLNILKDRITANRYKNILSLGAGQCVLEYLLKTSLGDGHTVVASDVDSYFIDKARRLFPEITAVTFDLCKDKISGLDEKLRIKFDVAVFFGASYVMDDQQFVDIFSGLKKAGVKEIVDFHAGYIDLRDYVEYLLAPVLNNIIVRRIFNKQPVGKGGDQGIFQGYARSRSEIRKLYNKSGLNIVKEMSSGNYKYWAILQ